MAKLSTTMLTAIGILLTFFISTTIFTGDDCITPACSGTPYAEACVSVLSEAQLVKPKMCTDVRGLAEFAVRATTQAIWDAGFDAKVELYNIEDISEADERCFKDCGVKLQDFSKELESKTNLADVRTFLDDAKTKNMELNCDVCRHGDDKKKADDISKGNMSEKMMVVLPVLIDRALLK
jgi:hypothetical protein